MRRLGLIFTLNVSVEQWKKQGLLNREKLLYEEHLKKKSLDQVFWFSFGKDDQKYERDLKGIRIVPMPGLFDSRIGRLMYSFIMPFWHRKIFKNIDIIKTNQMPGSWSALLGKLLFRKRSLLRTGWTWSINYREEISSRFNLIYWMIQLIEWISYKFCDLAEVSSAAQRKYIIEKYHIDKKKIGLLPNYIDVSLFKNRTALHNRREELLYIGRLEKEKNLFNLIKASADLKIRLNIYGEGSLKKDLLVLAEKIGAKVFFNRPVSNEKLPLVYNKYTYFILPSFYECMPKVLLEAMACGCICFGTDTSGINEIINDKKNGYLIRGTESGSIIKKVTGVVKLSNKEKKPCSDNASDLIKERFTLQSLVSHEEKFLDRL